MPGFEDLELIQRDAGMPVGRFRRLIAMPRATWYRLRERHLRGSPASGPWPTPTVDAVEAVAASNAE